MTLWLKKSFAYVSSLILASLAVRAVYGFVEQRIFDGHPTGWFVVPAILVSMIVWVYLAAFLYSRLAPLAVIRQWERAERAQR